MSDFETAEEYLERSLREHGIGLDNGWQFVEGDIDMDGNDMSRVYRITPMGLYQESHLVDALTMTDADLGIESSVTGPQEYDGDTVFHVTLSRKER